MIPLELSKELNPNLLYDEVYKRYTMSIINDILKIKFNILQKSRYMLVIKYNSISNPNLRLCLNGNIIDNNLLKKKTGSLDYIISINYKCGPYNLNEGDNLFELYCLGRFPEIYEMYLETYTPLPFQIYQYKPSDFIIIRNYNIYGGFYWNLNNILVGLMACNIYKKIPIICLDTGFYMNNSDLEGAFIKYCTNWFSYYFEDPVKIPGAFYSYLVSTKKKVPCIPKYLKANNPNYVYSYNRQTFNTFCKLNKHKSMCKKYLKIHPNIESHIDKIKAEIFTQEGEKIKYIGIHYRGTDKIAEKETSEEFPIHYEYQKINEILSLKKQELEKEGFDVYIIITTDEQPFINFMVEKMGNKILYYKEGLRSQINTSGMNDNFENIIPRNKKIDTKKLSTEEQKTYNLRDKLINSSLHIGHKEESNYKKGLDCLIDAKLLDRCDIYYKSKGNFSLFCYYFNNNENIEIYDLNYLFTLPKNKTIDEIKL
tara:strand:- start:1407 stop:2855 length:1449 start_codon:yes stop_codon:yes gene_type:complete